MTSLTVHSHLHRRSLGKDFNDLATYKAAGGFKSVTKAKQMGPDGVIAEVKKAVIRGRGGAGFPAGVKWGFVPKDTGKPKYLVVNADESEPGTFKDIYFLSEDPYRLIEGCIITSMALDIHTVYIYARGEFHNPIKNMWKAIKACYADGILGKNVMGTGFALDIYMHQGAGAYICGEETGLLESLEGKPGQPRMKPPFPAVVGAFGCPTVINNVETIAAVPLVIEHGAQWWADLGVEGDGGSRIFGISGHVNKPGQYELNTGAHLDKVIFEVAGGVVDDLPLKAVIPGGVSCPVLTPDEIVGLPMNVDAVRDAGSMLGTCGVIVIAEGTCIVRCLQRVSAFYKHESCGQCTPCREGSGWMSRIVDQIEAGTASQDDLDKILDIADEIGGNTICALGDAAAMPVLSFVKKFRDEFQAHIDHGGCPFEGKPMPGVHH